MAPSLENEFKEPLPLVRVLVRDILTASPNFKKMDRARRRKLAASMVRVCHAGASLLREEWENRQRIRALSDAQAASGAVSGQRRSPGSRSPGYAVAQSAGSDFSGVSAQKVAGTTQAILNAVSFPRFVTDLINGVFKAMTTSNMQQMQSYVELLNNVSASLGGFAETNFNDNGARQWLLEKFPGSFEISSDSGGTDPGSEGDRRLQLKDGAKMPSEEALRAAFGLTESDSIPSGDAETALLPFARVQMARQRQQMLATMVMLGMQRIVVEGGRITASMRFHIDTRSAAQADQGSTFNLQNRIDASGSYGFGAWGVSASMSNTIGYVSTQKSQTTEEMNTDLDLNSSVEINFKTDYLPLSRLTTSEQAGRIRSNTLNPEEEAKAAEKERAGRNAESDRVRRDALNQALEPKQPLSPPEAGAPGSIQAAEQAREKAAAEKNKQAAADS